MKKRQLFKDPCMAYKYEKRCRFPNTQAKACFWHATVLCHECRWECKFPEDRLAICIRMKNERFY